MGPRLARKSTASAASIRKTFRAPLISQRQILIEALQELEESGAPDEATLLVERICRNFPYFLLPLKERHNNRAPFLVEDEYDVQDAMHGLLQAYFDDVRPEDYVPEYAGARSRVDFLLKSEGIVIEVKMTRKDLGVVKVGEQLIIDIARYKSHPDCKTLIAFVYDPERRIKNRRSLEHDLTGRHDGLNVHVYIVH